MPTSTDTPKQAIGETEPHPSETNNLNVSVTQDEEKGGFETCLEINIVGASSTTEIEKTFQDEQHAQEEKEALTVEAIVPANEENFKESDGKAEDIKVNNGKRIVVATSMILIILLAIAVGIIVATSKGPRSNED
mmetsp:Transcript_7534/g.10214  ORF Transcript_7534/g.10214 Transcript_7534/m.10214 type:complete len:135 (-) Transcript_7534:501-905(-)|eukprot:CAMPEP_0185733944 /NCGR_PEP_ID=MMETSP1171-20130828/20976_1 /TAXON_ID=374046 /ORGANISM="Helicotheca tamensis, Strain CCMP826" /LENGTH=134 /DNA_ID=CAMNT_0028403809 /DNA_START=46 /DNA_END=450 /DNA_ORIENTATION=-